MKSSRFHRKPLVLAMMTLPGMAMAADADQAKAPEQQLGAVVVTDTAEGSYKVDKASSPKLTQSLKDTPRTISVVPESVIKDRGATTLADVLRNVSGISMAAGEGGVPAGDNLTVRGFSARTDMFVDGARDIGGYTRDPFNLGSVEVSKGPSSSYTGRGSTGGSINLVSKQPQREDFTSGSTGLGTDNFVRQTFDINRVISDTAAARLNLMYQDNDVPGRDHVENRRLGVAPSLQLGQGTDTRTTFSLFHLEGDNTPDYGIPFLRTAGTTTPNSKPGSPAPVPYSTWYGLYDARANRDRTTTDMATVQVDHDISGNQTLRQVFRYGRNDRDSRVIAPRFITPTTPAAGIRREIKGRDAQDEILTSQTDLTSKFKLLGLQHTLVTGVELTREKSRAKTLSVSSSTAPVIPFGSPSPTDPITAVLPVPDAGKMTANTAAVYAFDTVAVNKHLDINAGVRYDRYDLNYDYLVGSGANAGKTAALDQIDRLTSWNTGVVYKPVPAGSIYLSYGTSFNPSVEGLTLSYANIGQYNGLPPEKNRTLELGSKWSLLKNRLALTGAVFRTDKTNGRTVDATTGTTTIMDGEQRVDGVEASLVGQITPAWQVLTSYTHLRSNVLKSNTNIGGVEVETGNDLANVPENSGSLWTTYQINNKWQVGAGAQYVSERYSSANDATRNLAPSYTVWDAMASYQASRNVNLRLNAYNIGDKDYIGTVGGGHAIPGQARSATLTASYQF